MKKIITLLVTLVTAVTMCTVSAGAEEQKVFTYNNFEYIILDNGINDSGINIGTIEITGYYGTDTFIDIPSEIEDKAVTSIGERAFYYNDYVKDVDIPDSVINVGSQAFFGTPLLDNQNTTEKYVDNWLVYCPNDATGTIDIKDGTVGIAYSAFNSSKKIENVTLPDSLLFINDLAFAGCRSLQSIVFPNNLLIIGGLSFYDCELIEEVEIPDSVTHIGGNAFQYTPFVDSQTTDIKYAGEWVLDCDTDAVAVEIKEGTAKIANYAFLHCDKLEKLTIPDSVKIIGRDSFKDTNATMEIICPEGSVAEEYAKENNIKYSIEKITINDIIHDDNNDEIDDTNSDVDDNKSKLNNEESSENNKVVDEEAEEDDNLFIIYIIICVAVVAVTVIIVVVVKSKKNKITSEETAEIENNDVSEPVTETSAKNVCPNCSAEITPTSKFCKHCGAKISE